MSRPLRVVVATDEIGPLDSRAAGVAIAEGWADAAQVAVVPIADAGLGLGGALASLLGGEVVTEDGRWWLRAPDTLAVGFVEPAGEGEPGWRPTESSAALGAWLAACLPEQPPRRIVLDLTGVTALDGGAGLLQALGATAGGTLDAGIGGLAGVAGLELAGVRGRLGDAELIGVVDSDEAGLRLLGLQGAVARRGYQARLDPADLLAAEAGMTHWLAALGLTDAPGDGAAGGAAAAVRALGGRVVRGAALCAELAGLEQTVGVADLVVTGCTSFDIGNRGGRLVRFVAELAVAAERPCLVVAVESTVSRREMRTFGVEAAYATGRGPILEALTATAARLARGWTGLSGARVDLTLEGTTNPDNGLDPTTGGRDSI